MIPRKGAERDAAATNARIDRELTACMLAAQAGDERAYRRVLTAAGRHAARVARKGLRGFSLPTEDVEDIVQETLLALHAARGRWRSEAGVLAWVGAIARHKTIDAIRIACARQTTPIETEEAWLEDAGREPPGTRLDVARLMEALRPRQRVIVTEVMLRGYSVREVAQRLEITAVAGRVALHRAMRAMADAAAPAKSRRPPRRKSAGAGRDNSSGMG